MWNEAGKRTARVCSSEPPPWAGEELTAALVRLAAAADPSEAGGFLIRVAAEGVESVTARALPGRASRTRFRADPAGVLQVLRDAGFDERRIVGTFHSHPDGAPALSRADSDWFWWGSCHALVIRGAQGWRVRWFTVDTAD